MNKTNIQKEALFNEVKGSLFEFLVGQHLARHHHTEKEFLESIDRNYLNVLIQQDRMIRQFYPEMGVFLQNMAGPTVKEISRVLGEVPTDPRLMGKLINSAPKESRDETDLTVSVDGRDRFISLKLNKKGAFVNTKSGGIKSFFSHYFSFLPIAHQENFNQLVDLEFERMSRELHEFADLEWTGSYKAWVEKGFSELPGELPDDQRDILKRYYSRLASAVHSIMSLALETDPQAFSKSLLPLMGFSSPDILQVVCFHDFKKGDVENDVFVHDLKELETQMKHIRIEPFGDIASVEISMGSWTLQVRIKPMNKFTTTAIKMNCSVKVKRSSEA